ncbi:hypothetical protein H1Q59_00945 [Holosporaceae bacterium 'Namur']|nr:hypothetical protein [Holosporaceae bacterium 'Namur']
MNDIGDIIRRVLFFKGQSTVDFAKKIDLPLSSIENVIYKNVRKKEVLEKISIGLGVNLFEYFDLKNSSPTSNNSELDLKLRNQASDIVNATIKSKNIECPKHELKILTKVLYKFLLEHKQASEGNAKIFCEGMIEYGLSNFMLTYKSSQS